jgi:hypothetical protein
LKRDVQKRLDKLERRTQRAIAELIRALSTRARTRMLQANDYNKTPSYWRLR